LGRQVRLDTICVLLIFAPHFYLNGGPTYEKTL